MSRDGHRLEDSCFYGLRSIHKLSELIFLSRSGLESLADTTARYTCWNEQKKSGGIRAIEAPHENLKAVQKRIADLLQRIHAPEYLMAPVKKRSYVTNAAAHVGSRAFRLLDIEDFFPSCTEKRVFWFFRTRMRCASDVAVVLSKLVTFNGHLPQGSPCSPIMAFYAYEDMWAEINGIVEAAGCKVTVYADDITISGETVYERDVWSIKQVLHRYGFSFNRKKERRLVDKPADVTGVVVSSSGLLLPNRQHKKLGMAQKAVRAEPNRDARAGLERKLRGRKAQADQILNHPISDR